MIMNKLNDALTTQKNTLPFKRNLTVAIISSSLLFACGGSSESGGAATTMNITGTASKGLILGGAVKAYLIKADGTKGAEVGTATTDSTEGTYKLTLDPSYDGEAIIIEITAVDGSQMKCDLSVCQDDPDDAVAITFGEIYPLPTDFTLSAVSAGTAADTISINITPLTDISAALTLDKVKKGTAAAAAAASSNYQITNLLGLAGDVTELPVVDLTDAEAINAADGDALKANLKSAAVVEAALAGSTAGTRLEDALDNFVTQYVSSNGVAKTEGADVKTASVSLEEIAAASKVLTSKFSELPGVSTDNAIIAGIKAALITEEADAAAGDTQPHQGDTPDNFGSEGLRAAKEFVAQVSKFNLATQLAGAKSFEDEISLASDLASSDLDINSEALALATDAIAEAVIASTKSLITSYQSGAITVAISLTGTTVKYTVDQTLNINNSNGVATPVLIDLEAVSTGFSDSIVETEGVTSTVKGNANVNLAVTGSVSTAETSITINNGSNFIANITVDEQETDQSTASLLKSDTVTSTESGKYSASSVDIGLSVSIAQIASTAVTDPVSFTGTFNIAATLLSIDSNEESTYTSSIGSQKINIDGLNASLSGIFSNSSSSLTASVAIIGTGIEETCAWDFDWSNTSVLDSGVQDNTHTNSNDCSLTSETASTYGTASINVRFALDINGIDGDVELVAALERSGLESAVGSIDLSYGGNTLDFAFDTDDFVDEGEADTTKINTMKATLTNHDDVILTITDVETDYVTGSASIDTNVTTGVISHEGEEFATVIDGIVTFSDGTFVTL